VLLSTPARRRWAAAICRLCRARHKRHSFATHLLKQNIDIRVVLGHSRLETTALYTRVATNTIREVMSPLDRLTPLWPKKDETKQETKVSRQPDARRCWSVQGWRLRISSVAMDRRGARPTPAMSASANSR
jgi:hypothetical protein